MALEVVPQSLGTKVLQVLDRWRIPNLPHVILHSLQAVQVVQAGPKNHHSRGNVYNYHMQ